MKLTKALKQKNQLAGEVAELKARLTAQNSRPSTVPFDYNASQVLAELRAKVDALVKVKSAIAVTNSALYPRIFRLAELKGLVATLKSLDVRKGLYKEGAGYGQSAYDIEYTVQIEKSSVDNLVAELEAEISTLQDELDEFNHQTSVELTS
jgi:hypothetical protein